jgi:acetyl esterase/lipase
MVFLLATAWAQMGGAQAAAPQKGAGPARDADQTNISYGPAAQQDLDLYLPAGRGPHRLVVFAHGGAWENGGKGPGRFVAPALTKAGYALASVNYRTVPAVTAAQSVTDVAAAAAFLLKNAAHYGIDPQGFVMAGHSSGGHIAGLIGTDPAYLTSVGLAPADLRAVLTLDGVFDITANLTHYPNDERFEVFGHDPTVWRAFSPTEKAATMTTHPRFCVAHEDTNPRLLEQSQLFITALHRHGQTVEALTAPGLTHADMVRLFSDPAQPIGAFAIGCLARAFQAGK